MLIQFTVGNFRTFKDKATLSLVASNYDKETRESENIIVNENFNLRLLKSAVIYGANASGKSKFIEAMRFMRWQILNSFRETQIGESIEVHPFALHIDYENAPSFFEIIFLIEGNVYRYGFEVNSHIIVSEWLYNRSLRKEVLIFERKKNKYKFHPVRFKVGNILEKQDLIRNNALLLSSAALFGSSTIANVIGWFKRLRIISGLREEEYEGYTVNLSAKNENKEAILEFLQAADFNISDISLKKFDVSELPLDFPKELKDQILKEIHEKNGEVFSGILTKHKKYNNHKSSIGFAEFSMSNDESSGTRKFFALAGPLFDSLQNAYTLIIDELDSKLHPNLACKITGMFNSVAANPNNAQLIFNTHNTNLLNSGIFRRDQIWFTEKDRYGAAKLFSLADIKDVRKSSNFEESYIEGRYGAIPYLGDFDELLRHQQKELSD